MSGGLHGYRSEALTLLRKAGAGVGDRIKISRVGEVVEGVLMPRTELGEAGYIVVKLSSGYNIGVKVTSGTQVEVVERGGGAPRFSSLPLPCEREGLPQVAVIGTGGTIASRVEYRTGAVFPSLSAEELYSAVPELAGLARIKTTVLFSIFSENMTPKLWGELALSVAEHFEGGSDGIVVPHGTDTLAYTAAALSFALQNLPAPVVLVGSQRSSDRPSSDAALNLIAAVRAAAYAPFAGVAVAMHERLNDEAVVLHWGTKVRKCHTSRRDAFKSVNASPLARVGEDGGIVMLDGRYPARGVGGRLEVKASFEENVVLIKYYPGMPSSLLTLLVDQKFKGIILEGTGLGHVNQNCLDAVKQAVNEGVFVGMTSQCIWGSVRMTVYDTGRDLLARGVIPLDDMLPETALVKLMWSLGQTSDLEEVKRLMLMNIAGEYSGRISP